MTDEDYQYGDGELALEALLNIAKAAEAFVEAVDKMGTGAFTLEVDQARERLVRALKS